MIKIFFEGDIIRHLLWGPHEINIEFLNLGQPLTQMDLDRLRWTWMDQDGPGWTRTVQNVPGWPQTDPGVEFKPKKAGIVE